MSLTRLITSLRYLAMIPRGSIDDFVCACHFKGYLLYVLVTCVAEEYARSTKNPQIPHNLKENFIKIQSCGYFSYENKYTQI